MVLGNWPTGAMEEIRLRKAAQWAAAAGPAHLRPIAPPPPPRSQIVTVKFESGVAMRKSLFAVRRAIQEDPESDFLKVWVAPERPTSQAFRRRRLRQAADAVTAAVGPTTPVRFDPAASEVLADNKVVVHENAAGMIVQSPLFDSVPQLRLHGWVAISTRRRD